METSSLPADISSFLNNTVGSLNDNKYGSKLNIPYTICEVLVAICAVFGNGLVIIVFSRDRKLRRRTNYYIISLATADLLVGLFAIPFAILASIGLPNNLYACMFTVSVLIVLCTISIFCLVAVSIDRYWAILYPMGYSRTVRTKTAIGIICICWIAGTSVGFLPLLGWNTGKKVNEKCIFTEVMHYDYLVFLYFTTIIFPALLIGAFYAHIYRVVVKQLQQIVTMDPTGCSREGQSPGTMLRLLGAAQKREVKATQNLSRIVIFFIICWFPLYTINCVMAFCPQCQVNEIFLNFCIILSHLNSVGNPILYAYHLKDFRAALKNFIFRFLFHLKDPKAKAVSVVHERGSLVHHHSSTGILVTKKQDSIYVTEGTDKNQATNLRTLLSLKHKEERISQISTPDYDEHLQKDEDYLSEYGSPNISNNSREMRENESFSTDKNSGDSELESSRCSAIELRAYKSFLQFIDSDMESFEENNPESTLVIEADVNQTASSHERLTIEDSN